jgi:hypothetical protein
MDTLPPEPSYNPNIPIITSSGGTSAAYKDPNSPESIMKRTTLLTAQARVDTKYNVNVSAHEPFICSSNSNQYTLLVFFLFLLVSSLFVFKLKRSAKLFILVMALPIFLLLVRQRQKHV